MLYENQTAQYKNYIYYTSKIFHNIRTSIWKRNLLFFLESVWIGTVYNLFEQEALIGLLKVIGIQKVY